jgi:3-methyladenine DNA glycosylase AlkD
VTAAGGIVAELAGLADPDEYRKVLARVGDPDAVIGVAMRDVFDLARRHTGLELADVAALFDQPAYEARMVAVSILDAWARDRRATVADRRAWAQLYLDRHDRLDQWDLVDRAAPRVIGGWLLVAEPVERGVLTELAGSADRNRRRTAITATYWLVRHDELDEALRIADRLIDDPEPLVRTAVGVALREVGRVNASRRDAFLTERADRVPAAVRRVALAR